MRGPQALLDRWALTIVMRNDMTIRMNLQLSIERDAVSLRISSFSFTNHLNEGENAIAKQVSVNITFISLEQKGLHNRADPLPCLLFNCQAHDSRTLESCYFHHKLLSCCPNKETNNPQP